MKAEYLGDEGHLQRDSAEREEYAGAHMRLNRRVPNGTHGGVRGRILNEWVASYSITRAILRFIAMSAGLPLRHFARPFCLIRPGGSI